MADENSIEANIEFRDSTQPLQTGLGSVAGLTAQISEDAAALEKSFDDLGKRVSKIKEAFDDVLNVVNNIKGAVELIGQIQIGNQTALNSSMQLVNEILSSVKGLGGNIGNAMSLVQMANGNAGFGPGATSTSSQDFSGMVDRINMKGGYDQVGNRSQNQSDYGDYVDRVQRYTENPFDVPRPVGVPPSGPMDPMYTARTPDPAGVGGATGPSTLSGYGITRSVPGRSVHDKIRDELSSRYTSLYDLNESMNGGIIPAGKEGRAASLSYGYAMKTLNRTVGRIPFIGKDLMNMFGDVMESKGVTPDNIRRSEANNTITGIDPATGERYTTRTAGIPEHGAERKALDVANKVAKIFGNKMVTAFTEYAGYAGIAATFAENVAGYARQLTGYAQAQGSLSGQVNLGQSINTGFSDFVRSDFGLNPNFSFQDVQQNRMNGMALGLKNNQLNQYIGLGLNAQTSFGMSAQQAQSFYGAAIGAGVDLNTAAQGLRSIRALQSNSTLMSSNYSTYAQAQAQNQTMSVGATGLASQQAALNAVAFGGGTSAKQAGILQSAGMTGTEMLSSTIGQVLLAQQLHTNLTGLYATMQNTSGTKLSQAIAGEGVAILQKLGINPDDPNVNQEIINKAFILSQALPQFGITNANTMQLAVAWAQTVIKQYQVQKKTGPLRVQGQENAPKLTPAQVAAVNSSESGNYSGVVPAGKGGSWPFPYHVGSDPTKNPQININRTYYGTTPSALTGDENAVKASESQFKNPAGVVLANAALTQANADKAAGNYAQAVEVLITFDNEASKYLKAVQTSRSNGKARTQG